MPAQPVAGCVAIVTGANHGIGAATTVALAHLGAQVAITYLRLELDDEPGRPPAYAAGRRADAAEVMAAIEAAGARAVAVVAVEADLADPASPARIFDAAEERLGPVSILVNNASGWRKDSFSAAPADHIGRENQPVTAASIDAQLLVDVRGGALMMAELAARHRARGGDWGRIISLTSGRPGRVPRRGLLRGGQGGPGELHDVLLDRIGRRRHHRQRRLPADYRQLLGHRRRTPLGGAKAPTTTTSPAPRRWPR
jgi:NAD(P)-dependent dehydrogenase (short-subunit alcohol dehydrogenase family)